MQRHEPARPDGAAVDHANAGALFERGLSCALGRTAPVDLVSAHKWLNLAALFGSAEAVPLRHEIAAEMTKSEIATAQRAARDWLARH
jgi:TPR repeat protein